MARGGSVNYYEFEVQLISGAHLPDDWTPGRVFYTPGSVTLLELAKAIDRSFGRWDLLHEREFEVGRKRYEVGDEAGANGTKLDSLGLKAGSVFTYVFDLGDEWRHRCMVRNAAPDLHRLHDGWKPDEPMAVYGWGSMPDQYGVDTVTEDGPVEDFPEED